MRILGNFEVVDLGVHQSDYFQGFGSEGYDNACVGIGSTEEEALDDCMEMMAQSGIIIFDDNTEERIRDEYGAMDDTAICADCNKPSPPDDPAFGDGCAGCDSYYHIGIRWNNRAADRYKQILSIENLEPLRYESYEREDTTFTWHYVRRADGSVSCGDFHITDWPETVEVYFNTLCDDIEETNELYFYVPFASGSDYSGSVVEKANAKCIEDDFGENEWVHPVYGGYNTYAVAIGLTGLLTCDDDTFDELCEVLEGLVDNPCIDDEALSLLEMELSDEAWDNWASRDFEKALENKFEDYEFIWPDDFRSFFEEKREQANEYWECKGYGPDMYIRLDPIIKSITFDDIEDYAVQYEVSYLDVGKETEYYYDEDEAIERVDNLREDGFADVTYRMIESDHLKIEAMQAVKWRGHTMGEWIDESENTSFALCMVCAKEVQIIRKPAPNEVSIGGPAVALECNFQEESDDLQEESDDLQEESDDLQEARDNLEEAKEVNRKLWS